MRPRRLAWLLPCLLGPAEATSEAGKSLMKKDGIRRQVSAADSRPRESFRGPCAADLSRARHDQRRLHARLRLGAFGRAVSVIIASRGTVRTEDSSARPVSVRSAVPTTRVVEQSKGRNAERHKTNPRRVTAQHERIEQKIGGSDPVTAGDDR